MDPRYIYKPEEYNCQMNEVVSSRCKRNERAKRAHSLYMFKETIAVNHQVVQFSCHHLDTSIYYIYMAVPIKVGGK